jgi:hypothetical protein
MIINIFVKSITSEEEVKYMGKYFEKDGLVAVQISNHHIVLRDKDLLDPSKCKIWESMTIDNVYGYLSELIGNAA